jgi:hypothetical protein
MTSKSKAWKAQEDSGRQVQVGLTWDKLVWEKMFIFFVPRVLLFSRLVVFDSLSREVGNEPIFRVTDK